MRVTDPIYSPDPITPDVVERVLSTVVALQEGKGPKVPELYDDRVSQVSQFSGQPSSVVKPIYDAYWSIRDGADTSSKTTAATSTPTTSATPKRKIPTIIIVGGIAALLLGVFLPIMAKKARAR